jgi:hypothetical protein
MSAVVVKEETIPAEADCGMRRFSVTEPDGSRISLTVIQECGEDCEGEIHPVSGIALSRQVVTNGQLAKAVLQLAAVAVKTSSLQSL